MRACDVAEAACHSRFHFKPRKFAGNSLDFIWRDEVELQADDIQTDAGGAQHNFRFFVKCYGGRRVEGNTIPDQLISAFVERRHQSRSSGQDPHLRLRSDADPRRPY
jgi:hypothetical protein